MNDLIRKQDAIDAILVYRHSILSAEEIIDTVPSAQPERETGVWMPRMVCNDGHGTVKFHMICSKCGDAAYEFNQPYCHHCGTYMKG